MESSLDVPVRVLSDAETGVAVELAAAQRSIRLLTDTLAFLAQLHEIPAPEAIDARITLLEAEIYELREKLKETLRREHAHAARQQFTLDELDVTMRHMLRVRDEIVRSLTA